MSSYSLKFHRLTIAISASGTRKNSRNTSAKGTACHHAPMARAVTGAATRDATTVLMGASCGRPSGSHELVPLPHHVFVLVHDRVPAGDAAHAFFVAAAVAHSTGLRNHVALRTLDVLR